MATMPSPDAATSTIPRADQAVVLQGPKENPIQSRKPHAKEEFNNPALMDLNSQLYARGLTRSGLKLEGLNSKAQDQVIKVISKLLSQRAVRLGSFFRIVVLNLRQDDFTQLEAMQTSHRVLSHDLDRLTDIHKDLKTRVIKAEKERELAKSQVA